MAAAGRGTRMGVPGGKQYLDLAGIPMLARTLKAFEEAASVDALLIVAHEADVEFCRREIVEKYGFKKVLKVVAGGAERQHSIKLGLDRMPEDATIIGIHDGARPLITPKLIDACYDAVVGFEGAMPGIPLKDTPKVVREGLVIETLERQSIWAAQTPQVFPVDVIKEAHASAAEAGFLGTDDASLVERMGGRVRMILGEEENIKVTTPIDLLFAEMVLSRRSSG